MASVTARRGVAALYFVIKFNLQKRIDMSLKIGIHMLTAYPPSNPNRDENGQPKTAIVGGVKRQRISSQCIKRTWRLSEMMKNLEAGYSTRTRIIGVKAEEVMVELGVDPKLARKYAMLIAEVFGSINKKKGGSPENSEMVTVGHEESFMVMATARALGKDSSETDEVALEAAKLIADIVSKPPVVAKKPKKGDAVVDTSGSTDDADASSDEDLKQDKRAARLKEILQSKTTSLDVAMFGRMRAAAAELNVDASIYVSHPLTTGKAVIDSDFWTSVDDLNIKEEPTTGAGGIGDVEFGSGTFYTYVQVNLDGMTKNLGGDQDLAKTAVMALINAMAKTSPSGHKTTFNSEVRASFARIEVGAPSGNLFCKAFEKPVEGTANAIEALRKAAQDEAYAYSLNDEQVAFEFIATDKLMTLKDVLSQVDGKLALV